MALWLENAANVAHVVGAFCAVGLLVIAYLEYQRSLAR